MNKRRTTFGSSTDHDARFLLNNDFFQCINITVNLTRSCKQKMIVRKHIRFIDLRMHIIISEMNEYTRIGFFVIRMMTIFIGKITGIDKQYRNK